MIESIHVVKFWEAIFWGVVIQLQGCSRWASCLRLLFVEHRLQGRVCFCNVFHKHFISSIIMTKILYWGLEQSTQKVQLMTYLLLHSQFHLLVWIIINPYVEINRFYKYVRCVHCAFEKLNNEHLARFTFFSFVVILRDPYFSIVSLKRQEYDSTELRQFTSRIFEASCLDSLYQFYGEENYYTSFCNIPPQHMYAID